MADIEHFLLEQLKKAICDAKNHEAFKRPSFVLEECGKLKDLIENKKHYTGAAVDATRRENLYHLNNIITEWRSVVLENQNKCAPQVQVASNQLKASLKKIRDELEASEPLEAAIPEDKTTQDKDELDEKFPRNPYEVDLSKIYGIHDKSKAMERLLVRKETKNRGFQAIGIVGMTGVGKTTFCQVAFNNAEVKRHFLPRIWVVMSKQPKDDEDYKKEMVKSFLRCLGFEYTVVDKIGAESSSSGLNLLLLALRRQLQGKRYLVVLDDIWHLDERFKMFCSGLTEDGSGESEEYKWKLASGLPKGSGGTVIVTSRSENWAIEMVGEKNLHKVTPLEDKESCWNIFLDAIYAKGYQLEKGMEKLHDEIVKRCAGLPLIAKMLGEILVKKFEDERAEGKSAKPE